MKERARILKGTLDIVAAKEGGAVVKLRIPIEEQHEADLGKMPVSPREHN